eukprot:SAG11_NODE_1600_length_4608_cov_3.690397_1_plen_276_part_10
MRRRLTRARRRAEAPVAAARRAAGARVCIPCIACVAAVIASPPRAAARTGLVTVRDRPRIARVGGARRRFEAPVGAARRAAGARVPCIASVAAARASRPRAAATGLVTVGDPQQSARLRQALDIVKNVACLARDRRCRQAVVRAVRRVATVAVHYARLICVPCAIAGTAVITVVDRLRSARLRRALDWKKGPARATSRCVSHAGRVCIPCIARILAVIASPPRAAVTGLVTVRDLQCSALIDSARRRAEAPVAAARRAAGARVCIPCIACVAAVIA